MGRTLGDFTDELMAELRRHTARDASRPVQQQKLRPRSQRDAGLRLPSDSVMLPATAVAPVEELRPQSQRDAGLQSLQDSVMLPALPNALVPVAGFDFEPDAGAVDVELGLDTAHMTPKPSQAEGLGGVAGVPAIGGAPAAGLYLPQVCAQPPMLQSHEHFPLASFVWAFVLVWLVAWVGLCVFPPPVLATGSTLGDASSVFLVPMLALLRFALASVCQCV